MIVANPQHASGSGRRRAPGKVEPVVSARGGERLTAKEPIFFDHLAEGRAVDFSITDIARQTMIGFGASFNEAGMIGLNALDAAAQEQVLTALFDVTTGAGLSAMKTVIAATDFMSAGPFYSYAEAPGDTDLASFSIARDLGPDGLVTYIKRAQQHGSFALQATMDYPPDWMLKDVETDQDVDPRFYPALADYYLKYLRAYAEQGIRIDYLSPFNEPGNYTKITPQGFRDLIKDHIGPLFERERVTTALQVNDSQFLFGTSAYVAPILDDPDARRYIRSLSYHYYDYLFETFPEEVTPEALAKAIRPLPPLAEHGYDGPEHAIVADLAGRYPDLQLWMTETCYFEMGEARAPWQASLPRGDFEDGEFWGLQIASQVAAGAAGWTYWNMILDQNGGPSLDDPVHGNPGHNVQQPVVIVDRDTGEVTYTGLYYYLAHFGRFVRPGAVRLEVVGEAEDARLLAFATPERGHAAILINTSDRAASYTLAWQSRVAEIEAPAHSITSLTWDAA